MGYPAPMAKAPHGRGFYLELRLPNRRRAWVWRKERDSNPRYAKKRIPDFESGAFDHSAIFPGVDAPILTEPLAPSRAGTSGLQHVQATHVRLECIRNAHTAIGLLVILQNRHQRAAHRQA